MGNHSQARGVDVPLIVFLLTYTAASVFHYTHNAVFLDQYPNMPAWLSPTQIYATWFAVTGTGLVGYLLLRRGYRFTGLTVLAAYGALGLDGLGHYHLAPLSVHTFTMNLTIWLEAVTAMLVLVAVATLMVERLRHTWKPA